MPRRFALVAAVHLVFLRRGEVLLARRANTGYEDGRWSVPAGHLEGGETVRAAAVREAEEEVGVRLDVDQVRVAHVMHRRSTDERVDFFVPVASWDGALRIAEPEKCTELGWFDPARLPDDVIPYVRAGIAELLGGSAYSEFGW